MKRGRAKKEKKAHEQQVRRWLLSLADQEHKGAANRNKMYKSLSKA